MQLPACTTLPITTVSMRCGSRPARRTAAAMACAPSRAAGVPLKDPPKPAMAVRTGEQIRMSRLMMDSGGLWMDGWVVCSSNFEQPGRTHAAADAHRHDDVAGAAALALEQGVAHQARAGHAVGVAD